MNIFTLVFIGIGIYMIAWWLLALVISRNDIADIAWGLGFVMVGWMSYFSMIEPTTRITILVIFVSLWGIRLAGHIFIRNQGKKEDKRYAKWREEWQAKGKIYFYARSLVQIFLLQGFFMYVISLPFQLVAYFDDGSVGFLMYFGIAIWLVGFIFETFGDVQLSLFIKNPENRGKIMKQGLWKYTRHPNYFGEVTQWWGIGIIAICAGSSWMALAFASPLLITFLILKVSGIPMLEKGWENNSEFQDYKKRTSAFFPGFPRK